MAVAGERDFEGVYLDHRDAILRFCISQVGDRATAEDLAADTFTAAFAALPKDIAEIDNVPRWLFRIARNQIIDHYRRRSRGRRALAALMGHRDVQKDVEDRVELRQDLRDAAAALHTLSKRERTMVGLRIAGGLSYADVAGIVGTSEANARQAVHRSLKVVRAIVEGQR